MARIDELDAALVARHEELAEVEKTLSQVTADLAQRPADRDLVGRALVIKTDADGLRAEIAQLEALRAQVEAHDRSDAAKKTRARIRAIPGKIAELLDQAHVVGLRVDDQVNAVINDLARMAVLRQQVFDLLIEQTNLCGTTSNIAETLNFQSQLAIDGVGDLDRALVCALANLKSASGLRALNLVEFPQLHNFVPVDVPNGKPSLGGVGFAEAFDNVKDFVTHQTERTAKDYAREP